MVDRGHVTTVLTSLVQARREFLNNRRSGDFGYNTEAAGAGEVDDGWDFQSFVSPSAAADRN